ncbi:MAG: hypothetical protein K2M54_05235, partial [Muribaculaceae bacterium]|nr:hypothetical protein [Muribaculaceae bacterium]
MEFDVIGIYLPPTELNSARTEYEQGQFSTDRLKEIENNAVLDIVERQLECGLTVVTSGGIR